MTDKCVVKGCTNHRHQGKFLGDLCTPCYHMLMSGEIQHGATFIHDMERELNLLRELALAASDVDA